MEIKTFKQIKAIIAPIPHDQFCREIYENTIGQCCFWGHIQKSISGNAKGDRNGFGARELTRVFLSEVYGSFDIPGSFDKDGSHVNNCNNVNGYTEPEIKDRLMHMINDGIKWEESKLTI